MSFKNKYMIYKTGSLKESIIIDENIKIKTYYYVKRKINGQIMYLCKTDDKIEFTDFSNATPLNENEAVKLVNNYREKGINASLFTCSKSPF